MPLPLIVGYRGDLQADVELRDDLRLQWQLIQPGLCQNSHSPPDQAAEDSCPVRAKESLGYQHGWIGAGDCSVA